MKTGLVTLTWGNVSGIDRQVGLVVIKPSGVPYDELQPECMVVVDLEGRVVEGDLKPSSDTPTHLVLYRAFEDIGGVVAHAQPPRHDVRPGPAGDSLPGHDARRPLSRPRARHAAVERAGSGRGLRRLYWPGDRRAFCAASIPTAMPAVLVAGHAPFTWGASAEKALDNSVALEAVAEMVLGTWSIDRAAPELEPWVLEKHYQRKHGPAAYYGQ